MHGVFSNLNYFNSFSMVFPNMDLHLFQFNTDNTNMAYDNII